MADNVLELGRLNLTTGEYRPVKQNAVMPGSAEGVAEDFTAHCRMLAENFLSMDEVEPFCARYELERLRAELLADPQPICCRWRKAEPDPCPWVALEVLPAKGCSEKEPWAVIVVRWMK